jgi:hypothetical protein
VRALPTSSTAATPPNTSRTALEDHLPFFSADVALSRGPRQGLVVVVERGTMRAGSGSNSPPDGSVVADGAGEGEPDVREPAVSVVEAMAAPRCLGLRGGRGLVVGGPMGTGGNTMT